MKKFLILITFLLSFLFVNAQDSTVIKTYDHVKADIIKVLEGPGKHVMDITVRQSITYGYISIISASTIIISVISLFLLMLWGYNKRNWDETGLILTSILGGILIIAMILFLLSGINHVLNPEYFVIQDILESIK